MKKVFFLEDHTFFAEVLIDILKDKNIELIHASNYKEAEKLWKENKDKVEFAILDILLANGRTGLEFYHQVMNSSVPAFFLTGCIDDKTLSTVEGFRVVQKNTNLDDSIGEVLMDYGKTGSFLETVK